MKKKYFFFLQLLVTWGFLNNAMFGRATDVTSLIADARSQLESNKAMEGLAFAREAVRSDPNDFRGHYYVALAYLAMEKFDEAEVAAKLSLGHATAENTARVETLIATINESKEEQSQSTNLIKTADEAFDSGLAAKAAELYRKAFLAKPTRGDAGLKAAMIYAERLDRLMDAAVLWNKISISSDENSATQAKDKLLQNSNALDELYKRETKQAITLPKIEPLIAAFPRRVDLRLAAAVVYAWENNIEETIKHLSEAVKNGATLQDVSALKGVRTLLARSGPGSPLETFLTDAFGSDLVQRMNEQTRKEVAAATEEREMAIRKEQERKAEQERLKIMRKKKEQAIADEAKRKMEAQQELERADRAKQAELENFSAKVRALKR